MPPICDPPVPGRVLKVHRMPGHYVAKGDSIVSLELGLHLLTICAEFDGKIMRGREVGEWVNPGEMVTELTGVGKPTWELFVAYRRVDAPGHAGRVGERLIAHFGPGQVFKDVESLPIGVDFVDVIREKLQQAFAMVVIIGPRWAGDQRLSDPEDLHREEIRTATQRGIHIVPVLVNGASMPRKEEVPEDLWPMLRRMAVEITDTRWDYDVGKLLQNLDEALAKSPRRQRFLAQVQPWRDDGPRWQWVTDDPSPQDLE